MNQVSISDDVLKLLAAERDQSEVWRKADLSDIVNILLRRMLEDRARMAGIIQRAYEEPDADDYVQCPGCCHTVIPGEPYTHCNDKDCPFCTSAPCKLAIDAESTCGCSKNT